MPPNETTRSAAQASRDLGQKEAEMEKSGKEQMSHMEGYYSQIHSASPKALTGLAFAGARTAGYSS